MRPTEYRVIDVETGNEDLHTVASSACTPQGFLKLFYARWIAAPRGSFFATVTPDGADIVSYYSARTVARFRRK